MPLSLANLAQSFQADTFSTTKATPITMQNPDSFMSNLQPRRSPAGHGGSEAYYSFPNDDGRDSCASLECEASDPSSTPAWPSNGAFASNLDPPVSNIPSTAMSFHSSMSRQLDLSPSLSQPTVGPSQHSKKKSKESTQPSSRSTPKGRTSKLPCPFCSEVHIQGFFGRKHDLKRHLKDFHRNTELWHCPERDCGANFDWKSALGIHLKQTHQHVQKASKDHMAKSLPQLVFACGFSNCKTVFEVGEGDDAAKIANKFFEHVADTIDQRDKDNLPPLDWKYQVRFRNLMRQESVDQCWKDRRKGHPELVWQHHSSFVLRKILETRCFSDTSLLVQWAMKLGSPPFCSPLSPVPELPLGLTLPIEGVASADSSDHGSQCSPCVQPSSPMDHPVPPATGLMDLGEPFPQPSPASPQCATASQCSGTPAPQRFAFDPSYYGFGENNLQNQGYAEHSRIYYYFPHGPPASFSFPIQQQTSQYGQPSLPRPEHCDIPAIDPRLLTPNSYPPIPNTSDGEMEMQDTSQREYGYYD